MIKFTPFPKTTVNKKVKNVCNGENENEKKRLPKLFWMRPVWRLLSFGFSLLVVIGANPRRPLWSKGREGWGLNIQQFYQVGRQLLTIVDNYWQLLTIVDNSWQLLIIATIQIPFPSRWVARRKHAGDSQDENWFHTHSSSSRWINTNHVIQVFFIGPTCTWGLIIGLRIVMSVRM